MLKVYLIALFFCAQASMAEELSVEKRVSKSQMLRQERSWGVLGGFSLLQFESLPWE